jgi:hypothetical protein
MQVIDEDESRTAHTIEVDQSVYVAGMPHSGVPVGSSGDAHVSHGLLRLRASTGLDVRRRTRGEAMR